MQGFLTSVRQIDQPTTPPAESKTKIEPRRERRRKAREAAKADKSTQGKVW
jgi:hypothetical protein